MQYSVSSLPARRDQMGVPALSSEDFASLERIPVLGTEAIVVEITGGSFEGMAGEKVDQAPGPGRAEAQTLGERRVVAV